MTNQRNGCSGSMRPKRIRRQLLVASSAICALAPLSVPTAIAQTAPDPEDDRAVVEFFRAMNGRISEGASAETVAVSNGRARVGYYRVRITALPDQPPSQQTKGCKAAIKSSPLGENQLLDVIFRRRYDMGLAVSLPLTLKASNASGAPDSRAEVNLFRLTQTDGKRCGFSLSYFEKEGDYAGPWIPIDHQATALPQEAVIKFRPWASREGNKARVDAFFKGLGSFVNLIGGPVTTIGTALFGSGKDEYEIKGQANASIFSFTNDIKSADPPQATKRIVVNPTSGTSFTPKSYAFDWDLSGNDGEPFTYKLHYTIDIQYWASRLFARESHREFPNLKDYKASDFRQLLGRHDVPGGLAWNAISQPIATLSEQDTPDKFQIACKPAFAELASLGFSREDQVLIVYGTAAAKDFTPTQLGSIDCLFGPANATEVLEKLAKFQISRPVPEEQTVYTKSKSDDWYRALLANVTALSAPSVVGAPNSNFRKFLAPKVRIGGDTKLIVTAAGVPVLGNAPVPFMMDSGDLLKALAMAKPMTAGCYSPRKSSGGTPLEFPFPELSGMPASGDRQLTYLAEVDDKVFMVVIGIAGLNKDLDPVIDQMWFGSSVRTSDTDFHNVGADMLKSTDSSCVTRPSFKAFLEGVK